MWAPVARVSFISLEKASPPVFRDYARRELIPPRFAGDCQVWPARDVEEESPPQMPQGVSTGWSKTSLFLLNAISSRPPTHLYSILRTSQNVADRNHEHHRSLRPRRLRTPPQRQRAFSQRQPKHHISISHSTTTRKLAH